MIRVSGKGRRQTVLPLTQEVGDALVAYIKDHRPQADTDAVFVRSSAPYRAFADSTAISILVARAMRRTGINCPKRGAAHILRHSVASSMLRQGVSLQEIAGVLRHRSIATTEIYAKVDVIALRADSAALAGGEGMLSQDVQSYLAVRRAMGFGMKWSGNLLRGFAAFSEAAGQHHVCSETAIKWAGSTPSVRTRARRLGLVIRLARYLRAEDQRHEVPPPVFGSEDRPRRTPYIYSKEEVQRLVQAASGVGRYPNPEYRGLTYSTFFGLLACTGMRLSEAINLRMQDITADGLVIRHTKFRKSRLLPLHSTTQAALERYLPKRRVFAPFDDHVFVGLRKHKLFRHDAYVAFRRTIETIGLPRHPGLPRPTIHALRHTFAVRALETCPDDRDRITRHMVALSTYLGHSDIEDTYWYLEATPKLMRNIAESSQRYFMGGRS